MSDLTALALSGMAEREYRAVQSRAVPAYLSRLPGSASADHGESALDPFHHKSEQTVERAFDREASMYRPGGSP